MPTPDVATYLGLEVTDLDEATLIEQGLAHLATVFPDYVPRPGNTEYVLLEAIAGITAELGYAINRLPDGLTEVLLGLFGLTRDQGAPPTIAVTFTVNDTLGHTVPAGTTVRLNLGDDVDPVDFTTIEDLVIPSPQTQGNVTAGAVDPTLEANGVPAGTVLEVLDAVKWINSAKLQAAASGGREAEDGETFLDRAAPILQSLTTTLVRSVDIRSYIYSAYPDVSRCEVFDINDHIISGAYPGSVLIFVCGPDAADIGQSRRDAILADVNNRTVAGLNMVIGNFGAFGVDADVTVTAYPGSDIPTVTAAIKAALADYLSPDNWPYTTTLFRNEVVAVVDKVPGVNIVQTVTLTATGPYAVYMPTNTAGDIPLTLANLLLPRYDQVASTTTVNIGA